LGRTWGSCGCATTPLHRHAAQINQAVRGSLWQQRMTARHTGCFPPRSHVCAFADAHSLVCTAPADPCPRQPLWATWARIDCQTRGCDCPAPLPCSTATLPAAAGTTHARRDAARLARAPPHLLLWPCDSSGGATFCPRLLLAVFWYVVCSPMWHAAAATPTHGMNVPRRHRFAPAPSGLLVFLLRRFPAASPPAATKALNNH